ncbi:MAG: Gfo/Idh/MocA family protein [Lachnotalea sp.]
MRKINWGVLGTANIAKKATIPAMLQAENCNLYGIAGRNKEKVDQFKDTFGFLKAFYSLEDMLEDKEVEAVYIPLPNHLHKEWVIKAAKKGKNVLCEKPLAQNAEDIDEMIRVCDEEGVVFMEAFAYLHSPVIKEIKSVLDSGVIGTVSFMESTFFTPANTPENIRMNRETLGGSVYDLGCYNISLTVALLGKEPEDVKALAHFTDKGIDDFATAYMGFADGVKACFSTGMCCTQRADRFFLYGTKGMIEAPIPFNQSGTLTFYTIIDEIKEEHTVEVPNNYKLEVEQLGRCITDGEKPYVSHAFSLANGRTIDKVLKEMGY